jgi:carbamoyl-phosphate synthase large subunit
MKSVGEVMAIGRTFQESMQKALRGLEVGKSGFDPVVDLSAEDAMEKLKHELRNAGSERIWYVADALRAGLVWPTCTSLPVSIPGSWCRSRILSFRKMRWRRAQLRADLSCNDIFRLKRKGFSDKRLSTLLAVSEKSFRQRRLELGVKPVYKRVDTCAAEFASYRLYVLHL